MAAHAEGKIEARLRRLTQAAGGQCHKLTDQRGVPDRILVFPDRPAVYVEVKTATGRLSRVQEYWGRTLQAEGFEYSVVRSKEDVDRLFERLLWGRA